MKTGEHRGEVADGVFELSKKEVRDAQLKMRDGKIFVEGDGPLVAINLSLIIITRTAPVP
jgi:hypothetical protein